MNYKTMTLETLTNLVGLLNDTEQMPRYVEAFNLLAAKEHLARAEKDDDYRGIHPYGLGVLLERVDPTAHMSDCGRTLRAADELSDKIFMLREQNPGIVSKSPLDAARFYTRAVIELEKYGIVGAKSAIAVRGCLAILLKPLRALKDDRHWEVNPHNLPSYPSDAQLTRPDSSILDKEKLRYLERLEHAASSFRVSELLEVSGATSVVAGRGCLHLIFNRGHYTIVIRCID